MLNTAISLGKRQLVDSIWKSAGIEGLGTTFPDTERILENLPVMTTRDEVLFIINMKHAWEFLFENIEYPVNISYLRELNKICMTDIIYNAGSLRNIPVSIGGTSWKPEMPHEGVIIENIRRINLNPDKLESALDMFCYVARTQMFLDGNKRVAQLICNKILMENDIGILSIPYERIPDFSEKLIRFYESGDSNEIKFFFRKTSLILNPEYEKTMKSNSRQLQETESKQYKKR